jgi:hypothetical protein
LNETFNVIRDKASDILTGKAEDGDIVRGVKKLTQT